MARPLKTVQDTLPPNWKDLVLKEMVEGASKTEVKAMLFLAMRENDPKATLSRSLFWRWLEEDKEFSDTIKEGEKLSEAWWKQQGRKNLWSKEFSFVGWYMNMKNRFGWRDHQDITTGGKALPTPIYGGKSGETV